MDGYSPSIPAIYKPHELQGSPVEVPSIQSSALQPVSTTMDQVDANLFDPLMGAKEGGGGPSGESNGVMVEDLLGGFSEMVPPDLKAVDPSAGPANGSATSFFLLDLDTGGGGETSAPDFMVGKTGALRPTSAMESISDNSEVLSITEANLPMGNDGNNDDALMSGFFNDVLQADSAPDGATLANAATVQIAMDGATTSSSETTLVGEETVTATGFGNGLMMGASEENLDSIMDLEVPTSEPSRDLFDTVTEVEPMLGGGVEGSGRLVKVSTLENLVTEEKEEGVIGGDKTVNGEVVKQPPGTVLSDDDEHPLASQLRPVFEMFDPEGKGWIGVDQLQELCQSQGQVTFV